MTVFELFGGIILFGILWLLVPRASFIILLWLYLYHQYGFFKEEADAFTLQDIIQGSAMFFLFIAIISGLIIDIEVFFMCQKKLQKSHQ